MFQVYFDIAIGEENIGQIEIGLFGRTVPRTVKNFKSIADGFTDVCKNVFASVNIAKKPCLPSLFFS